MTALIDGLIAGACVALAGLCFELAKDKPRGSSRLPKLYLWQIASLTAGVKRRKSTSTKWRA